MKIIDTDNFGGDYPNEKELNLPRLKKEHAENIVREINKGFAPNDDRYWYVVEDDYKLAPGFTP